MLTTVSSPAKQTRRVFNILYRIFNTEGELLYVGCTTNPAVRFQEHQHHQPWWEEAASITLERLPTQTRGDILAAEADAIRAEKPKYNTVHAKAPPFRRRRPRGTGTVHQRADGTWVAALDVLGSGRKYFYSQDRITVEQKLADFKASLV